MEEKDIQELFGHIRAHLPPNAKIPKLTRVKAAVWCKQLAGYTLDQLKHAAEEWGAMKPFWPDPDELKDLLPPIFESPEADQGLAVWWAQRKDVKKAAGVPTLYEALHQGMTMEEYDQLCEEKGV